jgi:hypothetical protein
MRRRTSRTLRTPGGFGAVEVPAEEAAVRAHFDTVGRTDIALSAERAAQAEAWIRLNRPALTFGAPGACDRIADDDNFGLASAGGRLYWPICSHVHVKCPWCGLQQDVGIEIVRDTFAENAIPTDCFDHGDDGELRGCVRPFLVRATNAGVEVEKL